jgi:phage antirepressor YoqD-like protein
MDVKTLPKEGLISIMDLAKLYGKKGWQIKPLLKKAGIPIKEVSGNTMYQFVDLADLSPSSSK